jgi:hypothetical protein
MTEADELLKGSLRLQTLAQALRGCCDDMLSGDFSRLEEVIHRGQLRFFQNYGLLVGVAFGFLAEVYGLRAETIEPSNVVTFRGCDCQVRVLLDGPCVRIGLAKEAPTWREGDWLELQDIIWFVDRAIRFRLECYLKVFHLAPERSIRKQVERLAPLTRRYCDAMLGGDFSAGPEIRRFTEDPRGYAAERGWPVEPGMFLELRQAP